MTTTLRLLDQVVLITGAARGIGRATALRAAAEGADIAAIDLDDDGLDSLVEEVRAMDRRAVSRRADVSDAESVRAAVDALVGELGPLRVAHANAGILMPATTIEELDLDAWHRIIAVNLTGVVLTFRAAVPHFGAEGGVPLATGSSTAIRPGTGLLPYVAAKAGVHTIVRSLALELAPRGIRVNVIAPRLSETEMTRAIPGHIERGLEAVPLGQLVDVADVAALAVHLMTDEAHSITGAVFPVDAGRTAL